MNQAASFGLLAVGGIAVTKALTGASFADVVKGHPGKVPTTGSTVASTGVAAVGAASANALNAAARAGTSGAGTPGPVAGTVIPTATWNPLGKPIADWIVPVLTWAAAHGWTGTVTSGYRTEADQAAINASGAFSAPAGSSNHESTSYPGGAVDVTDPAQLIRVLAGYTGADKLIGGILGAVDPEHFSATGH